MCFLSDPLAACAKIPLYRKTLAYTVPDGHFICPSDTDTPRAGAVPTVKQWRRLKLLLEDLCIIAYRNHHRQRLLQIVHPLLPLELVPIFLSFADRLRETCLQVSV